MSVGKATPILRIFEEAKAREFYLEFLGFKLEWEHRFDEGAPLYMSIRKGACELHLSEHHGDVCPGAAVRIEIRGIDEFCRELNEKRYKYSRPEVEDMPWGSRDMSVKDPFGNRLTFAESASNPAPMPGVTRPNTES